MKQILRFRVPVRIICACFFLCAFSAHGQTVSGELMKWHKVTLTYNGVNTCENSTPNPFTDYRLTVTFKKGAKTIVVPGYYAANGVAGNNTTCGNKWRVHFTPDETGLWTYTTSFRTGANVAISDNATAGTAVAGVDGLAGSIAIAPSDKTGNDLRAKGMLSCVNDHYHEFAETKERFIKGGANSPENILAYHEFDQTSDLGGLQTPGLTNGLHQFAPHVQDWNQGDPTWLNGKGKGIIGMLNYLASQGINSVYFLTYNVDGGDGQDVWMWTSAYERYRFDCSKLDQWEVLFSHMDSLGIQMHVVVQERENDQVLGGNSQMNNVRKLYFRELIARYSHHLAVQWNIGEENDHTDAERAAQAQYFRNMDPYKHPIVVHTQSGNAGTFYDGIFSNAAWLQLFDGTSIQGEAVNYNAWSINLREESRLAGKKWTIAMDEQVPPVMPDGSNFDELRRNALWGNLMGGGSGIEWYFGYNATFGDVQSENMRIVEPLWKQTRYALEFFQTHLPFEEMEPKNNLVSGMNNFCFAKEGEVYAIYMKNGTTAPVALSITHVGDYSVQWYHPKTGGTLKSGSVLSLNIVNPGTYQIGQAPYSQQDDWVALLQVTSNSETICAGDSIFLGGAYRKTTGVYHDGDVTTYLTVQPCNAPCLLEVQGLTLMFEGSAGTIGPLTDGLVINKDTLCRFNVRADVCHDAVKSVKFKMNGAVFRIESTAPFAMAGDNPSGVYNVWIPNPGTHTLSVTPHSNTGGGGTAGPAYTVTFTIVDGPAQNTACNNPPVMDCNGNINGTASYDTCGICSGGLTGVTPNVCNAPCNDQNACTNDARVNGTCVFTPIACNDNISCTIDQCVNGQCVFTQKVCNDNSSCTSDQCANGICVYTPNICNDNNACTSDACSNGQCTFTPLNCNDNNACTTDGCANGACSHTPIVCNDNNSCTTDNCVNGQCVFTPTVTCNDNNACTNDNCANGQCVFVPILCNDNNSCTSDNCVNGQCIYTNTCVDPCAGVDCDDNNPCTTDACNNGACSNTALVCNDNSACTNDNCANGQCVYTPKNCNDGNACTIDACSNGACINTPKNCNDNNACTTDGCSNGICSNTPLVCNDNNLCTNDACNQGQCTFTFISCNDNNSCTFDACDNGLCVFAPNPNCNSCANINCNDNNACTIDTCVNGNCIRTAKSCNDFNTCTFDMCSNGNCYRFPVSGCSTPCPDGVICNDNNACTADYCGSNGRCAYPLAMSCADDNPCTSDGCVNGQCVYQNTCTDPCASLNCNDNNACTTDNCMSGQCVYSPIICNDNNACTNDNCVNGQCISTPKSCNDNNACTSDNCVNGQCAYIALSCTDNDNCTSDNCSNGQCIFTPISCNDNNACTTDKCVGGVCTNAPLVCNDGNACTTDNCSNGQCLYAPIICDDNNACTTDNCSNGLCTYTPRNCNDNNSCTEDNCVNGICSYRNTCGTDPCDNVVCNDADICTSDTCINGTCNYNTPLCNDGDACTLDVASIDGDCQRTPLIIEPAYIKAINPAKSWRKLKIGYDAVNFWAPKQNVIEGGNNTLCITLRTNSDVNWSAIQFRTVAANLVVMGNYIPDDLCPGTWTKVCIPLSDFPAPNFNGMSYIEFPYSFGAEAFEIDILKIEFTGGATPFIWFGDEQTDNIHDGESGSPSALQAEVIYGDICNAAAKKPNTSVSNMVNGIMRVYPVPFKKLLQLDVSAISNGSARVSLVNVIGQTVQEEIMEYTEGANQLELRIGPELASGIYLLRFESDEMTELVKVIKAD